MEIKLSKTEWWALRTYRKAWNIEADGRVLTITKDHHALVKHYMESKGIRYVSRAIVWLITRHLLVWNGSEFTLIVEDGSIPLEDNYNKK